MFIEGLRTDSLYLIGGNKLRVSQLIAVLTFVAFTTAIKVLSLKAKKHTNDLTASVYYLTDEELSRKFARVSSGSEEGKNSEENIDKTEQSTIFVSKDESGESAEGSEE